MKLSPDISQSDHAFLFCAKVFAKSIHFYPLLFSLVARLKRSNSASLTFEDDDEDTSVEFHRGGRFRATAGPRLGWAGLRANRSVGSIYALR